VLAFLKNLAAPASSAPVDVGLWAATGMALAGTALTAFLFWRLADVWWPATVLLFGPRWVLLLPVGALALAAVVRDRALMLPLAVAAAVIVGPIMGFRTGWRALLVRPDADRDITVVTFNIGGASFRSGPGELLAEWAADVAAIQECGHPFSAAIYELRGWHVYAQSEGSQCLLSRFPILETHVMDAEVIGRAGGSGLVVSHLLQGDRGTFWITNVHLETPREGLLLLRDGRVGEGVDVLERDMYLREIEQRRARTFAGQRSGRHIVVGDFNTPPESRFFRTEWRGWTNAFSAVGRGLGATRLSGWVRARIDHVLVDDSWRVVEARPARDVGSDHLPMIATVRPR
jgi:endonuclease/exonuclease/phosphatase (EEP) superfamily protein YafD